jgi:hypothetical protein
LRVAKKAGLWVVQSVDLKVPLWVGQKEVRMVAQKAKQMVVQLVSPSVGQ